MSPDLGGGGFPGGGGGGKVNNPNFKSKFGVQAKPATAKLNTVPTGSTNANTGKSILVNPAAAKAKPAQAATAEKAATEKAATDKAAATKGDLSNASAKNERIPPQIQAAMDAKAAKAALAANTPSATSRAVDAAKLAWNNPKKALAGAGALGYAAVSAYDAAKEALYGAIPSGAATAPAAPAATTPPNAAPNTSNAAPAPAAPVATTPAAPVATTPAAPVRSASEPANNASLPSRTYPLNTTPNAALPTKPIPAKVTPAVKPPPSKLAIAARPDAASRERERIAAQSNLAQAPRGSNTTTTGEQPPVAAVKPVAPTNNASANIKRQAQATADRASATAGGPTPSEYQYVGGKPNPNYKSGEDTTTSQPATRGGSNNTMQPNIIEPQNAKMPLPANISSMSPADAATELRAAQAGAGKPVLEPGAQVVGTGTGGSTTTGTGGLYTTRSPDEIAWDSNKSNYGKQYPGAEKAAQQAADQKASGDRNLSAVKNFFGLGDKSQVKEGDDALAHIKQLSNITKESKETHMSMDFKKMFGIMDAISMNEAKMADIKGQKYSGSYGAEYQGDSDDEDTGTTVSKAPAEKKGRGRPKGDVVATNPKDTAAKRASDKESKSYAKANPTKVTRHTLSDKPPKGSPEYKEKKSSLKDWIESSEAAINEAKAKNKYAIGMAVAKKAADDEPPLKKSTIVKAHKIAKKIDEQDEGMFGRSKHDKRYLPKFDITPMNISDDPGMKANRTTKQGSLRTNAEDLEFAFGPPGDDGTWVLEFSNGLIATIYPDSDNISGMDWTIGGNHPDTQEFVHMAYSAALDDLLEGLKGGQKKLDVAPPKGKLDAKDFAALRAKKTVKEGIHMEDSHDTLAHVTNRFKHEVKQFMANPDMDMDDDLYEALFDYYLDSGEIPYGIAKARTGDPHQWVYNRFQEDMGAPQITSETAMLPEAFDSGETVYWRGTAGTVDRVEGDKCFVHTASGDMDVWPASECSKEKQGAFSIFKKDVSDIGTGLGRFATGKSEIDEAELEESPFTYAAKMAKAAGKESFTLGDKHFDVKESKNMDTQLESWNRQLNSLLTESLTISTTQGDQGDDTISVTASGADAQEVMAIMRNAGLGGMGNKQEDSTKFSNYGVPMSGDQDHEGTALITVDDGESGGDDMLSLMKKMSGIGSDESSDDYADEESSDEEESGSCNECGMSEGSCEHGQMVDEARADDPDEYEEHDEEDDENPDNPKNWGGDHNDKASWDAARDERKKSKKDEVEEQVEESYANSADDQADQDIDFMMNTISGGLNRRKRDQTTLPHTSVKVSESNDLMAEFLKLSGLK
jgi:hypothetical protein